MLADLQKVWKDESPSECQAQKASKNKANAEVRELARTYTTVAIKTLADLMLSKQPDPPLGAR